jgi:Na+-driven multidrug efflux pump
VVLEYPRYYFYNLLNIFVGWTGNKQDLAAYSLAYTLIVVINDLAQGFNMFTRT